MKLVVRSCTFCVMRYEKRKGPHAWSLQGLALSVPWETKVSCLHLFVMHFSCHCMLSCNFRVTRFDSVMWCCMSCNFCACRDSISHANISMSCNFACHEVRLCHVILYVMQFLRVSRFGKACEYFYVMPFCVSRGSVVSCDFGCHAVFARVEIR